MPKLAILMCTYNGQAYLKEQLDSFIGQQYQDWELWISDDGSTDNTLNLLNDYQASLGNRLHILQGPKQGFAKNFLSLVCNENIKADYYAYSDQDDIWHKDKLVLAVDWLKTIRPETPALYGARSILVNDDNKEIGPSNSFLGPFSFKNALVQNVAAGNTMVFNQAAHDLLREAGIENNIHYHDWWTYILLAGCGGEIKIDPTPVLRYRQHGNNVVGCNNGTKAKLMRIKRLLSGHMKCWNTQHVDALQKIAYRLTPENKAAYNLFAAGRNKWLLPRLIGLKRSGIYRQTPIGNIGIAVAAFFGKL